MEKKKKKLREDKKIEGRGKKEYVDSCVVEKNKKDLQEVKDIGERDDEESKA